MAIVVDPAIFFRECGNNVDILIPWMWRIVYKCIQCVPLRPQEYIKPKVMLAGTSK